MAGVILANGGHLERSLDGRWWFVFDAATRTLIESRLRSKGVRDVVPARLPAGRIQCGPVPFMATLGGFLREGHPHASAYCTPAGIPQEWNYAWSGLGYGPRRPWIGLL
jgi:hypothetical protein